MSTKMIILQSSDGQVVTIDEAVAFQSPLVKRTAEDIDVTKPIPVQNVTGKILEIVIEYCKNHVATDSSTDESKEELKKWDAQFMKTIEPSILFDVMIAANFLEIESLIDLTSRTVADVLTSCKTPEEIRACLNITSDLTAAEEAKIRRENLWAFQ